MSMSQRPTTNGAMLLLGAGILCSLFGVFMFATHNAFASFFLGAEFLFGIPLTHGDAFKVLFFEFLSIVTIGMGVILLVVGRLLQSGTRFGAAQATPAAPTTH